METPFGARVAADREAVAPGQDDVDDRGVVRAAQQQVESAFAVAGDVDGVLTTFEHRANGISDLALIFDHEDPHGVVVRSSCAWVRCVKTS